MCDVSSNNSAMDQERIAVNLIKLSLLRNRLFVLGLSGHCVACLMGELVSFKQSYQLKECALPVKLKAKLHVVEQMLLSPVLKERITVFIDALWYIDAIDNTRDSSRSIAEWAVRLAERNLATSCCEFIDLPVSA